MKKPLIKVCGLKHPDNIAAVAALDVDLLGFIFYPPSPRYAPAVSDEATLRTCGDGKRKIGVFVDAAIGEMEETADRCDLQGFQLHGRETPETCRALRQQGRWVIKAFPIAEAADFQAVQAYEGCCDYFLFDTKGPRHGGNGVAFDWELLREYTGETPFLLSGGIAPEDAPRLAGLQHPRLAGFDLNSRFESEPGFKRLDLLEEFLRGVTPP